MLKEIYLTPQIFECQHLENSIWKDLKSLLQSIISSGYIVTPNKYEWLHAVNNNLQMLPPKNKDQLNNILVMMYKNGRFSNHPNKILSTDLIENNWLKISEDLNNIRPLFKIIATQAKGIAISVEQLEDLNIPDIFGITGSKQLNNNDDNLRENLISLLSYSKQVTIIDPYFYLHNYKIMKTLEIVAESLSERRGNKTSGTIIINCRWRESDLVPNYIKEKDRKDKTDKNKKKWLQEDLPKQWQKEIRMISGKYGHEIKLYVWIEDSWEKGTPPFKMHDRYFLTPNVGLLSAGGTEANKNKLSEWSIKDAKELNNILLPYKPNSSNFKSYYYCCSSSNQFQLRKTRNDL